MRCARERTPLRGLSDGRGLGSESDGWGEVKGEGRWVMGDDDQRVCELRGRIELSVRACGWQGAVDVVAGGSGTRRWTVDVRWMGPVGGENDRRLVQASAHPSSIHPRPGQGVPFLSHLRLPCASAPHSAPLFLPLHRRILPDLTLHESSSTAWHTAARLSKLKRRLRTVGQSAFRTRRPVAALLHRPASAGYCSPCSHFSPSRHHTRACKH